MRTNHSLSILFASWMASCAGSGPYGGDAIALRCRDFCEPYIPCELQWAVLLSTPPCAFDAEQDVVVDDCRTVCEDVYGNASGSDRGPVLDLLDCSIGAWNSGCDDSACNDEIEAMSTYVDEFDTALGAEHQINCAGSGVNVCQDTCQYDSDGDCDDGQAGSTSSLCSCGTDCTDCGTRATCS